MCYDSFIMKEGLGPSQLTRLIGVAVVTAGGAIACTQSPESSPQPQLPTSEQDVDQGAFISKYLTIIPAGTEIVPKPGEALRFGTERLRQQIVLDIEDVVRKTLQPDFADLVFAHRTRPRLDIAAEKATSIIDGKLWETNIDPKYNIWQVAKPSSLLFPLDAYRSGGLHEIPFNLFATYEEDPDAYEAYKKQPFFTNRETRITQYRLETSLSNANYYEELQPFVIVENNQTNFKPEKSTEIMEAVFQLPQGLRWRRFVHQFNVKMTFTESKPERQYVPGLMATAMLPDGRRLEAYMFDRGWAWVEITERFSIQLPYSVRFAHRINPLDK